VIKKIADMLRAQANAAIDKMTDPKKRVELMIAELDEAMKELTRELVGYKATEKSLAQKSAAAKQAAADWEQKAMTAVRAGDDALAKAALVEQGKAQADFESIERDRREQAALAAEMLKSRREVSQRLDSLKLRAGTIAQKLEMGKGSHALDASKASFEKLDEIGDKIEEKAIETDLDLEQLDTTGVQIDKMRGSSPAVDAELAALKEKMKK
jgi:phage shock protein A